MTRCPLSTKDEALIVMADRYLAINRWLQRRYRGKYGAKSEALITHMGDRLAAIHGLKGGPTPYSRLDLAFFKRYVAEPNHWGPIR